MQTKTLKVGGMDCGGCETSIQNALALLNGVASSKASYEGGQVEITYDPALVSEADLAGAIEDAGYDVSA
jgi:copper chaperone